jgi:hypothetical protein
LATINVSLPSDGTTAETADYNTPVTTIVSEINGNLDNANIKSNAAISGSKLADASIDITAKASNFDGWIPVSDSWSYASATTITVPTDATTKYSVGDKIKLVQSATTKYFDIISVASTVLTVRGVTTETVANSAISGIYYSKVTTPQGYTPTPFWQELARTTLTGAGDTISVTNIPARKYLHIIVSALATGGTIGVSLRFNNDSGTNYARRISDEGGADATGVSQTGLNIGTTGAWNKLSVTDVINIATSEKLVISHETGVSTAGAGNAPRRQELTGKWANTTDQITRVDAINGGTGDFAIGSEVVVLGHD